MYQWTQTSFGCCCCSWCICVFLVLFVLCESSSKPEIARNVLFDFFAGLFWFYFSLVQAFSPCLSTILAQSLFVVFIFAFGCCQMNYLRTHCVCLRFMLRPSSYWISVRFFFRFFGLIHWWNTLLDACCQWHGYTRKKYIWERKEKQKKIAGELFVVQARIHLWMCRVKLWYCAIFSFIFTTLA